MNSNIKKWNRMTEYQVTLSRMEWHGYPYGLVSETVGVYTIEADNETEAAFQAAELAEDTDTFYRVEERGD